MNFNMKVYREVQQTSIFSLIGQEIRVDREQIVENIMYMVFWQYVALITGFSLEFQKQESGTPPFPKIGVPSQI